MVRIGPARPNYFDELEALKKARRRQYANEGGAVLTNTVGFLVGTIEIVHANGTVDVTIDGHVETDIPYLASYVPMVGDTVVVGVER